MLREAWFFRDADYLCAMRKLFKPCIPTKAAKVPDRPVWIHEIEHDGYRHWSSSVRIIASEQNRVTASLER